ncbi:hypothetical protein D3C80_1290090 [compost metagenome]
MEGDCNSRLRARHVGARQIQQTRDQLGQAPRIGINVAEEATALVRFHVITVVLQKFDSALDTRQRRLELVADSGGEVPQIAGTAVHGLGHPAEVLIEVANLDGRRRGRRRHFPPAVGDVPGDPAQGLDRASDAARNHNSQDAQQAENGDDPEQDLASVLVDALEQGARRPRAQDDAPDPTVHHHRPGVMDAQSRGAAEPFHLISRLVGRVAAQDR